MSEVWIVLRREFLERVRSRSFVIGTFLFPVLMVGLYTLPVLIGGDRAERKLVVVDQAPAGIAQQFSTSLQTPAPVLTPGSTDKGPTFHVEIVRQPLDAVKAQLTKRVQNKEIDGYVYLPADVVTGGKADFRARNVTSFEVVSAVRRAASQAVQGARLQASGLRAGDVAALLRPVELSTARITATGEEGGNATTTFWAAYVAAMLIYMMTLLYGVNVMRSVLEEKTNRIAEVIVSSMRASHLMMGKIAGVASVALLQVIIWAVTVGMGMRMIGGQTARSGMMQQVVAALKVRPSQGLILLAFFILGFFLFASLFAALGAAVNSEQEAQQFQMWVMLPLIVPLMFLMKIIGDPMGQTATVLGMIPFTAPVTNALRLGTTEIPPVQVAGSLLLLALTTLAVAWIAGKIYRVGILSTGKRPSLAELGRWLRAA